MIRLTRSADAWGSPAFAGILKEEIMRMGVGQLPLQQGLSGSSVALDDGIDTTILSAVEDAGLLRVKAGIFYSGIVAGCSCADDPAPVEPQPEYCVVEFVINRSTGEATVKLVTEE